MKSNIINLIDLIDINKYKKLVKDYNNVNNNIINKDIFYKISNEYYILNENILKEKLDTDNDNDNYDFSFNILYLAFLFKKYIKTNNLINKKILIIDNNSSIYQSLRLINDKIKSIEQIYINSIYDYKINNNIKIYKSKYNFIDDNLMNIKKYDFIFISTWFIDNYYYNLIKNLDINSKIFMNILVSNFNLIRYIKFIFNNLNKDGSVFLILPGILNSNNLAILSLLINNFKKYKIFDINDDNSIIDYSIYKQDVLHVKILLTEFKKDKKIINEFNDNYDKLKIKFSKYKQLKIKNISELLELLSYNIDNNNEFNDKIKKLFEKKMEFNKYKLEQIKLITKDKIKIDIIQKENLLQIIRILYDLGLDIKEKYKKNNYDKNLFIYYTQINKHFYKIKNNDFNIQIIKPCIYEKNFINDILNEYNNIETSLNIYNRKIYNDIIKNINKHNIKFINKINKNNNYIEITNKSLEIYEILNIINLFNDKTNILYLNEHDGSYISAFDNFSKNKKIKYKWYYHSLLPGVSFGLSDDNITYNFDDLHDIMLIEPHKWDIINDGDITDIDNMNYYFNKYKNINLITINNKIDYSNSNIYILKLIFCYIIFSLKLLNKHGNLIFPLRIHSLQYPSILSLFTLLTIKFYKILLYKSNINISEDYFYIICIDYNKPITNKEFDILYNFSNNFNEYKQIINMNKINDKIKFNIKFNINKIIQQHIFNINRIINFTNNYQFLNNKEKEKIMKMINLNNKKWIEEFKFKY